jgi:hypothetical protein
VVTDGEPVDDAVLVEQAGQRISYFEAYPHRGDLLRPLCLYDYMSLVTLKRRANPGALAGTWGEIPFPDTAPFADEWVQGLRRPGKHAVVCLDGYLSMDFCQDDDDVGPCHRRFVRHIPFRKPNPQNQTALLLPLSPFPFLLSLLINCCALGLRCSTWVCSCRGRASYPSHWATSMTYGRGGRQLSAGGSCSHSTTSNY